MDNSLAQWFQDIDPTVLTLSADEWAARERQDLWVPGAVLIVVHDGGELSRYGSPQAWTDFARCFPAHYDEQLTGVATAIYRR